MVEAHPNKQFADFEAFWPYYVSEHYHPGNRRMHFAGTTLAIVCLVAALVTHKLAEVVEVSDRGEGTMRIPNAPWRFEGSDVRVGGEPRYRGEDNRSVLSDLLGLDEADLDQLEADGVLTSRLPKH